MGFATDEPTPALFLAAKNGALDELNELIKADAACAKAVDPSAGGKTSLAAAAGAGSPPNAAVTHLEQMCPHLVIEYRDATEC